MTIEFICGLSCNLKPYLLIPKCKCVPIGILKSNMYMYDKHTDLALVFNFWFCSFPQWNRSNFSPSIHKPPGYTEVQLRPIL